MRKLSFFATLLIIFGLMALTETVSAQRRAAQTEQGVEINGLRWATRNVAAPGTFTQNPEDTGMFYQWNRRTPWAATGAVTGWDSSISTAAAWEAQNNPCPRGWRVPTNDEILTLQQSGHEWTTRNGVLGRLLGTAPNQIFMPAAGWRHGSNGELRNAGRIGDYWSSSVDKESSAWTFFFNPFNASIGVPSNRAHGFQIRCVSENSSVQPSALRMTPEMTEFWEPQRPVVTPGRAPEGVTPAPSDAIVLFDGTDLSKWVNASDGNPAQWIVRDGAVFVNREVGDIQTTQLFNDFQLHIEWRIPADVTGESQGRGNSGIFLQGVYELQVSDNYNNQTYFNGQAGSIYKQTPPLVNAMRPPGEWNTYDIIYTAPTFKVDGTFRAPPRVTVLHNGVLVQNNTIIQGVTQWLGIPTVREHGAGPIRLQSHGSSREPVSFRNIWIREL
ncbi:MAG: DUF1080 domain-containing protein [Dysgonamonadaceae bacterium]|nr:DUF1080 domain-containing protein [Dysgonamonadaceae bacterium]